MSPIPRFTAHAAARNQMHSSNVKSIAQTLSPTDTTTDTDTSGFIRLLPILPPFFTTLFSFYYTVSQI